MTVLWFFLVISVTGEPLIYWGFPDEEDCAKKRNHYAKNMAKVTQDVTECIGLPVKRGGPRP